MIVIMTIIIMACYITKMYYHLATIWEKLSKYPKSYTKSESVLVFGHKIQGLFKEYSSTKNCVFKEYSKQVYFVLHYVSK